MADAQVLADLDRALAATEAVVTGVRADQWAAPTPCTELDARGVLNHLVRGNVLFVAIIRDGPRPVPGTDHLGSDPPAAFRQAATELREAFAAPGVLEAVYQAPFGTAPGARLAHVRVVEALVHGWDLARATGQPADFPEDVAEFAAARYLLGVPPAIGPLRELVSQSPAELTQVILTRRTQTNEPARCAVLLPALAHPPEPLALIDVGASAGLTLLVDRYSYDYAGHRLAGVAARGLCRPPGARARNRL